MDKVEGAITAQNSDSYTHRGFEVYQLGGPSSKWNGEAVTIAKDGTQWAIRSIATTRRGRSFLPSQITAAVVLFLVSVG